MVLGFGFASYKKIKCEFEENANGHELSPVTEDSMKTRLSGGCFSFANTISSFHMRPKKGFDR